MSLIQTNGSSQSVVRQFKVIVLGDMYTGKSNLVLRFAKGQFQSNVAPTIGASFISHDVCLNDNSTIRLQMWDTAGHERFHSLARFYFRGAAAAMVVYDITNQSSYRGAKKWLNEVQEELGPHTVIALVGNKLDLASMRVVKYEEAQTYADKNKLLFMETSGKTATNVNELFLAVAEKLSKLEQTVDLSQGIQITEGDSAKSSNRSCCK